MEHASRRATAERPASIVVGGVEQSLEPWTPYYASTIGGASPTAPTLLRMLMSDMGDDLPLARAARLVREQPSQILGGTERHYTVPSCSPDEVAEVAAQLDAENVVDRLKRLARRLPSGQLLDIAPLQNAYDAREKHPLAYTIALERYTALLAESILS